MQKGELMKGDVITWAGFNSSIRYDESIKPQAEVGILPLFPDKAASPSMMKHTMEIFKENTEFINAGQTPVLGADQPLYAICKQLKWQFPGSLGEDKFVMQLGALHIEDKCQLMLGKMLRGSDWNILGPGRGPKVDLSFFRTYPIWLLSLLVQAVTHTFDPTIVTRTSTRLMVQGTM